jgi:magnesium and cobalt transporter
MSNRKKMHKPLFSFLSKKNKMTSIFKKIFSNLRGKNKELLDDNDPFSKTIEEIKSAASQMSSEEKFIFNNFLLFGSKTVSKVMIPRSDICGLSVTSTKEEIYKNILDNGHTRTLLYQDTLDNIVGFVHIKDLFKVIVRAKEFNLKKLTRKHILAAPSMKLVDLLAEMQKRKTHIAVVLDEYGGTDGIVTIEDILEGIVGKIEDEHAAEAATIEDYKLINPKTILCNARVHVEDIERTLKIKLKKQDDYFETIGGLVLSRAGYFPKNGTTLVIEDNIFAEIIESTPRSIKTLKIMVK